MDFAQLVMRWADQAGWTITDVHGPKLVSLTFDTGQGPVRMYVRRCGRLDGQTVVELSIVGVPMPLGPEVQLQLLRLLMRRNAHLGSVHWGLDQIGDEDHLAVFASPTATAVDDGGFERVARSVVQEYEQTVGAIAEVLGRG